MADGARADGHRLPVRDRGRGRVEVDVLTRRADRQTADDSGAAAVQARAWVEAVAG